MRFGVLWLVVVAVFVPFGSVRAALSPAGENVCLVDERYIDVIQVRELIPVKVVSVRWCFKFPPRCQVETVNHKPTLVNKHIPRVRIVPKCCAGYKEITSESRCVPNCTEPCVNGECTAPETCSCESGFHGVACEIPCTAGAWGRGCLETCDCRNDATCDPVHGVCSCRPGWKGIRCDEACDPGYHGPGCEERCHCDGWRCHHVTGECEVAEVPTTTTAEPVATTIEMTSTAEQETETYTESTSWAATDEATTIEESIEDDRQGEMEMEETMVTANTIMAATTKTYGAEDDGDAGEDEDEEDAAEVIPIYPIFGNETEADNEIESDFASDVITTRFSLVDLLENVSIICGVLVLVCVLTMTIVMVSHYKKMRKIGMEYKTGGRIDVDEFTIHRFYGGSVLPGKVMLDDHVTTSNMDLEMEQPKMMTFKPPPVRKDEPFAGDHGPEPAPPYAIFDLDEEATTRGSYGYDVPRTTTTFRYI